MQEMSLATAQCGWRKRHMTMTEKYGEENENV